MAKEGSTNGAKFKQSHPPFCMYNEEQKNPLTDEPLGLSPKRQGSDLDHKEDPNLGELSP